jgi:two-component system cell cycle response regulator
LAGYFKGLQVIEIQTNRSGEIAPVMLEWDSMKRPEIASHRILVVDDDEDALSIFQEILKGYKVDSFTSPEKALKSIREHEYGLLLSDYQMPEMNGVEFFKRAIEIQPRAKRILVSAFAGLVDSEQIWNQARVHRIIAKPFKPKELSDTVQSALLEVVIEEENEKLRRLALTDPVTGASNQRYFWDRLRAELSRAKRFTRPLTVILFDVDNFKKVNDEKGHLEGDSVLTKVAETLNRESRQMDIVARYGGDEFALILPEIEGDNALKIATRLSQKVNEDAGVSISGGVACFPVSRTERELVANADGVLLRIKKEGKGKVELYSDPST